MTKRYLTGVKPTSDQVHIGNYFGSIKPMIDFSEGNDVEVLMFIPDLHALTTLHDASAVRQNVLNITKAYLACGLNPEKSLIYQQSSVVGHTQLNRILSCITNIGFMKRMHAFKAAVDQGKEDEVSMGTFNYPILMAADIILYDPDFVPVGKDQKQHVEFARDIAQKFNHMFGDTFKLPEVFIQGDVATVPGIDGRKMSKSYNNYIGLFDDADTIKKKAMQIPTDALPIEASKDPDTCNVYNIYKLFLNSAANEVLRKRYTDGGLSYKQVKTELVDAIIEFLKPIQARYAELDDVAVKAILARNAEIVGKMSEAKIEDVYRKVGLLL